MSHRLTLSIRKEIYPWSLCSPLTVLVRKIVDFFWLGVGSSSELSIAVCMCVVPPAGPVMFLLNGLQFQDTPTETPLVDSTELWRIINLTPLTHPIHLHLVQFRVLQRQAFNTTSFVKGQPPTYTGDARYVTPTCTRYLCSKPKSLSARSVYQTQTSKVGRTW